MNKRTPNPHATLRTAQRIRSAISTVAVMVGVAAIVYGWTRHTVTENLTTKTVKHLSLFLENHGFALPRDIEQGKRIDLVDDRVNEGKELMLHIYMEAGPKYWRSEANVYVGFGFVILLTGLFLPHLRSRSLDGDGNRDRSDGLATTP